LPQVSDYSQAERTSILQAHAALGSLAWIFVIPLGAILFKVLRSPHLFWIHTAVQTVGMCLAIGNLGLGVFIALLYHKAFNNSHTIIGVTIIGMMLVQPVCGFLQHAHFKKHGTRSIFATGHRWFGRATITLSMINGGLGFWLAKKSPSYRKENAIAYGVSAAITFVIWVSVIVYVDVLKGKNTVEKDSESAVGGGTSGAVSQSASGNVSKEMVENVVAA